MSAHHPISDVRALKHGTAQDALRNLECNGETVMLIFAGRGAPSILIALIGAGSAGGRFLLGSVADRCAVAPLRRFDGMSLSGST